MRSVQVGKSSDRQKAVREAIAYSKRTGMDVRVGGVDDESAWTVGRVSGGRFTPDPRDTNRSGFVLSTGRRARTSVAAHRAARGRKHFGATVRPNRADGGYANILRQAFDEPITAERASGSGRVYVVITEKEHAKGVAKAAKALGKIFQTKAHYGMRNALYIGYDNATGRELARGTKVVEVLKAHGIGAYRDEHGD